MDPIPKWLRRLWDVWDDRVVIIISLSFQVILFIFGKRRKYSSSTLMRFFIWSVYLIADPVATLALGKLSDVELDSNNEPKTNLRLIWTPLLLLHLGGPDTITAYSLEDNQLWSRHLLTLGIQLSMAVYVLLMTWTASPFSFLTLPLFVAGIIKYGERIKVLMSASSEHSKKAILPLGRITTDENQLGLAEFEVESLVKGYQLYTIYMPHIHGYEHNTSDVLQGPQFRRDAMTLIDKLTYWEMMEVELGLMYDMLYTKATIIYTKAGCTLRLITISCTLPVLLVFFWGISSGKLHTNHSLTPEIAITGVLLVGAILLELYGIVAMLTSDWTKLWLVKHHQNNQMVARMLQKFPWLVSSIGDERRRWSCRMGQLSASRFVKPKWPRRMLKTIPGWVGMEDKFKIYLQTTRYEIPQELKTRIVEFVLKYGPSVCENEIRVLQIHNCEEELKWVTEIDDYGMKIGVWHIATDLCFHDVYRIEDRSYPYEKAICKLLSDYVMYLSVSCPSMLRVTVRHMDIIFNDGVRVFKIIARSQHNEEERAQIRRARNSSSEQNTNHPEDLLLSNAAKLGRFLASKGKDRWKILYSFWLDMLCQAARDCPLNSHAQQCRRGGELLTLVWLLLSQSIPLDASTATRSAAT